MLSSFIITFRETLEAALIVGIILGYLTKTKQTRHNNVVYVGVVSGVIASLLGALLFSSIAGGFSGTAEKVFEGVTMLIGALLLTFMILWMMKQRHVARELENKIAERLSKAQKYGLFSIVFVSVLREGVETVIFLNAASFATADNNLLGALIGIVAAVLLGYIIFVGSRKIKVKNFFKITSLLLILFAAGLVAHGVHELQGATVIPTISEHIWDINPAVNLDGSFPAFHEKGAVGGILKDLFGYNGNPSLIEMLSYLAYLLAVLILWKNINKVHKVI